MEAMSGSLWFLSPPKSADAWDMSQIQRIMLLLGPYHHLGSCCGRDEARGHVWVFGPIVVRVCANIHGSCTLEGRTGLSNRQRQLHGP